MLSSSLGRKWASDAGTRARYRKPGSKFATIRDALSSSSIFSTSGSNSQGHEEQRHPDQLVHHRFMCRISHNSIVSDMKLRAGWKTSAKMTRPLTLSHAYAESLVATSSDEMAALSRVSLSDMSFTSRDTNPPHNVYSTSLPISNRPLYLSAMTRSLSAPESRQLRRNTVQHFTTQRAFFSTQPTDSSPPSSREAEPPMKIESAPPSLLSPPPPVDVSKKSMLERSKDLVVSTTTAAIKAIVSFILKLPGTMWFYLTHPREFRNRLVELKDAAKKEAHHFMMGSKLLVADVRTAYKLLTRTLRGSSLTRRERKQLLRTTSDLFRLVPFSMFVLIPFMEFALPFALRLFPNMLPSTFQDSLKEEESMKRELKSRIAMAQFFQETLQDLVKEQKKQAESLKQENADANDDDKREVAKEQEESATTMLEFLEQAKSGQMLPPEVVIQYANYFQDDLTLDNMPRMQLINMCTYMNIPPYGADSFLRFQLRYRIRTLKEDDQRILWEGINSLTKMELREACRERGMRSTGLSKDAYKRALQQWLDLSVDKNVPISLLIMSRTFFLREEMTAPVSPEDDGSKSLAGLADAISGLDKDVVNEAVLEAATEAEKQSNPDVMRIRLEVLEHQNERIREEQEAREASSKLKKEHQEKEKEMEKAESEAQLLEASIDGEPAVVSPTKATGKSPAGIELEEGADKFVDSPKLSDIESSTPSDGHRDEDIELSSQEFEALSQLVSPDPVNTEREQLERIKAAMKEDESEEAADVVVDAEKDKTTSSAIEELSIEPLASKQEIEAPMDSDEADRYAAETVSQMDEAVERESRDGTKHSLGEVLTTPTVEDATLAAKGLNEEEIESGNKTLDKSISRLKSKIESMVDKIEDQLTDVQLKIGEKLHFLDKDLDGIMTKDEMAVCLQEVLKRDLNFEEAMEIAEEMDDDNDGVFTVAEFIRWVDTNKLVKYVEEGRDADLDRSFEESPAKEEAKSEAKAPPQ